MCRHGCAWGLILAAEGAVLGLLHFVWAQQTCGKGSHLILVAGGGALHLQHLAAVFISVAGVGHRGVGRVGGWVGERSESDL